MLTGHQCMESCLSLRVITYINLVINAICLFLLFDAKHVDAHE